MLALVLVEAGLRPSFIIGGEVNEIGTNASWDSGELLVVEADESDGTFLHLWPELGIVTSVEPDHIEHYGSFEELESAFEVFVSQAGSAIVCADDPVAALLAPPSAVTYGCSAGATVHIGAVESGRNHLQFDLTRSGEGLGRFELPVPGVHNARNAAAAVSAALELGVDVEHARRALARFAGVARRFEFRGDFGGVTFVDDYAHLPGEVRVALDTALKGGFGRVVCVFQPHRYSRVAALAPGFADSFVGADLVVVTDIYPSGEMPRPGVSGKLVIDAIVRAHPDAPVVYVPNREGVVAYLREKLRPGDLCLTLAAGDLTNLASELAAGEGAGRR
jgi:UDP-N-acetylmuramate--alanine ligase